MQLDSEQVVADDQMVLQNRKWARETRISDAGAGDRIVGDIRANREILSQHLEAVEISDEGVVKKRPQLQLD